MTDTSKSEEESIAPGRPVEPHPSDVARVRSLIEKAPLYRWLRDISIPFFPGNLLPKSVETYCPRCKALRLFQADAPLPLPKPVRTKTLPSSAMRPPPPPKANLLEKITPPGRGSFQFSGECLYCHEARFVCILWYEADTRRIRKIGQNVPPWLKAADPALQDALGDDFAYLKKAEGLVGEGYGMGALAYLRRLVEDRIDPLLDQLVEFERAKGVGTERIEEIERIRAGRDFSAKATAVYAVIPDVMQVPGHNPLKSLHSAYSEGMHGLTEEECVEIARDTIEALQFAIVHLATRPRERRSYVEKIQELERRRSSSGE